MHKFNKSLNNAIEDLMDKEIVLRVSRDSPYVDIVDIKLNKEKSIDALLEAVNTLNKLKPLNLLFYYEGGTYLDREFGGFTGR